MLKALRFQAEWLLCEWTALLVPRIPRWLLLRLANAVGWIYHFADRAGRKVAMANLEVVFGGTLTQREKERICLRSSQNFARTFLDLFWSPRLNERNYREFFEFEDLRDPKIKTGGGIYICLHSGNFEWMSHGYGFEKITGLIIAQEFKNAKLEPIFNRLRQTAGQAIVARTSAMLRLFKEAKRGKIVALLIDLTLKKEEPGVMINAFGLKKKVTFLHAFLRERTKGPIVPISNEPLPDGRYRLTMHPELELPPNATQEEITQRCWDYFEPMIRKAPHLWLWRYKHFRYRDPENYDAYPFYARGKRGAAKR